MDIRKTTDRYIFNTYRRYPLTVTKAKGSWLWDDRGKKYLDLFSGLAVSGVGHALPSVRRAVERQLKKYVHTSNYYYTEPAARLAERLCKRSFAGKVFFANSGTEANECAIKLARRHGARHKNGAYEIIVFEHSFHGRTLGALAATAQPKFHEGFGPLPPGFPVSRLNDLASVQALVSGQTAAILIEPVQGEGGIRPARPEFLQGLRRLADEHGLLLMFDGVQCSLGRTGDLFSYQTYGVEPDVLTLAKGLGGGLPISAVLARESCASLLAYGDHGTTFGANPVCCAAASAVMELLTPTLLRHVKQRGRRLLEEVRQLCAPFSFVKEVRGLGYMMGIELQVPGASFVDACRDRGLLINCTQTTVLRMLPPLAISERDIRFGLETLRSVFETADRAASR